MTVLVVLESTVLVLQNTVPRGNRDGFDGFGFGGDGYPLKLNPLFPRS